MTEQVQTQTEAPATDTPEDGSLDAAALAFEQRDPSEEEEAPSEAQTDQPDPNAEAEEGQPDADTGAEETAELEFEGKTLSVPKELAPELQKALLRQADYSRKMNEVAEQGKKLGARLETAEAMVAAAEKLAEAKAQALIAQHTVAQFDQVDWASLEREDPARASLMAVKAMSARQTLMQAQSAIERATTEVQNTKGKDIAAKREEMHKTLSQALKGWGDEMGTAITRYATSNGVAYETLQNLTDPGVVLALEKARKYDELIKAKGEIKAKAQSAPPVLKPGAKRPTPNAAQDAMSRLRKSNSVDDAAAVFLSQMR